MHYSEYQTAVAAFEDAMDQAASAGDKSALDRVITQYEAAELDFINTLPETLEEAALRIEEARHEVGLVIDNEDARYSEILECLLGLYVDLSDTAEILRGGECCPGLSAAMRQQAEAAAKSLGHDSSAAVLIHGVVRGIARPRALT